MKNLKCYQMLSGILLLLAMLVSCAKVNEDKKPVVLRISEGTLNPFTSITVWNVQTPTTKVVYTNDNGQWVSSTPLYVEDVTADDQFVAIHTHPDTEKDPVTGLTDIRVAGPSVVTNDGILDLNFKSLMAKFIIKLDEPDADLTGATLSTPALYQTYTLDGVELTPTGEKAPYNTAFSSNVRLLPQDIGGVWSVTLSNGDRYMADMANRMLSAGEAITVILERTDPSV